MDTVLTNMQQSVKKFENTKHKIKDEVDAEDPEPVKNKKKIKKEEKIE